MIFHKRITITPPKFNILAPESHGCLEDYFSFPFGGKRPIFSERLAVKLREGRKKNHPESQGAVLSSASKAFKVGTLWSRASELPWFSCFFLLEVDNSWTTKAHVVNLDMLCMYIYIHKSKYIYIYIILHNICKEHELPIIGSNWSFLSIFWVCREGW